MNVYDFDGTIYNGDSTIDFFLYALKRKPSILLHIPKQAWGFILNKAGRIDKTRFKDFFQLSPFYQCGIAGGIFLESESG